jgi:hypothetical protein
MDEDITPMEVALLKNDRFIEDFEKENRKIQEVNLKTIFDE